MKRIAKRVVTLLVALLLLGTLASCVKKENDAPDGMMTATAVGADYRFYAPTTWNANTLYGVSGAYRDVGEQSTVSVNRYPSSGFETEEGENRNAAYWERVCLPLIRERSLNGEVTEFTDDETHAAHSDVLGDASAVYRHVTALTNDENRKTLHYVQVVAEREGYTFDEAGNLTSSEPYFYVLSFTVTDSLYGYCVGDADKMIRAFAFVKEPYVPEDYAWKPAKVAAPEGMKIASSDEVAYRFFVPQDWVIDRDQRIFAAYEPSDRTNVSVVPYMPATDGMTVDEFFGMASDLMQQTADSGSYEQIGYTDAMLGSQKAKAYDFTYTVGGKTYRYRQIIAVYKGMFYTLTYTASGASFEEHMDALNAVTAAFVFR